MFYIFCSLLLTETSSSPLACDMSNAGEMCQQVIKAENSQLGLWWNQISLDILTVRLCFMMFYASMSLQSMMQRFVAIYDLILDGPGLLWRTSCTSSLKWWLQRFSLKSLQSLKGAREALLGFAGQSWKASLLVTEHGNLGFIFKEGSHRIAILVILGDRHFMI